MEALHRIRPQVRTRTTRFHDLSNDVATHLDDMRGLQAQACSLLGRTDFVAMTPFREPMSDISEKRFRLVDSDGIVCKPNL